jgi:hypothetical protein
MPDAAGVVIHAAEFSFIPDACIGCARRYVGNDAEVFTPACGRGFSALLLVGPRWLLWVSGWRGLFRFSGTKRIRLPAPSNSLAT